MKPFTLILLALWLFASGVLAAQSATRPAYTADAPAKRIRYYKLIHVPHDPPMNGVSQEDRLTLFQHRVNAAITDGWQPWGPAVVDDRGTRATQVMVRYAD